MSQEIFFAQQKDRLTSFNQLIHHLGGLQRLHARNLLSNFQQRKDESLQSLRENRLRVPTAEDWREYLTDFNQRTLLFWDTLRQRGDNALAHERAGYPFVLKFDYEVLLDGRTLSTPVNYSLLRILPGPHQPTDESLPPVIVIDPRGGHGAGIGGFKEDSEIGESLRAGHPTYFIGFSHAPEPGQTLLDVGAAQAKFIETVSNRHPRTGKPVVIGNCQAGWALMGLAAVRPELPGLVIVAGAPLSYWAGVNGRNPMRYAGGLLGGAWMTRLGSDLGNGRFDGTWLVSNFEHLDPANTYWTKYYNLFANVDSEAPRFLDFERWWSSPVLFNSEEIETIVDDLFIGNRLSGTNRRKGGSVDLRKIEAPVVVFCSYGDNITPPQQALNWIADVYPSDLALRAAGRTIIYLRHADVGHLGIFVSGKVARREHRNLIDAIEAIQALPPGLFELIIDSAPSRPGEGAEAFTVHFEPRSIDDIAAGDDGRDEEAEFALVDRLSDVNSTFYDWTVRPWLSRAITEPTAEVLRKAHPFHQQRVAWSSMNPALWWLPKTAEKVRRNRRPVRSGNPLLTWQNLFASSVEHAWDTYRDIRDASQEMIFHSMFGWMKAFLGSQLPVTTRAASRQDSELLERLHDFLPQGGPREATLRVLLLLANASGRLDKEMLEGIVRGYRKRASEDPHIPDVATVREMARLQNLLVFAYPEESLQTLPELVPGTADRLRILAQVARVEPDWQRSDGALGEFWHQLCDVLELPLPAFLQPRPAANDEVLTAEPEPQAPAAAAPVAAEAETRPEAEAFAEPVAEVSQPQAAAEAAAVPEAVAGTAVEAASEVQAAAEPVAAEAPAEAQVKVALKAEPQAAAEPAAKPEAPSTAEPQAAKPAVVAKVKAPAKPRVRASAKAAAEPKAPRAAAKPKAGSEPKAAAKPRTPRKPRQTGPNKPE